MSAYQFFLNLIKMSCRAGTNAETDLVRQWLNLLAKTISQDVLVRYLDHFADRTPQQAVTVLRCASDEVLAAIRSDYSLADWVLADRGLSRDFVPDAFDRLSLQDFTPSVQTLMSALKHYGKLNGQFPSRLFQQLRTMNACYREALQLARVVEGLPIASTWPRIRIAVLSDATAEQLTWLLKPMLYFHCIAADVRSGEFQQFEEILLDSSSWIHEFQPDLVILVSTALAARPGSEIEWAKRRSGFVKELIRHLGTNVIATNIELTPVTGGANGASNWIQEANDILTAELKELNEKAFLFDMAALVSEVGMLQWFDLNYWNLSRQSCRIEIIPRFASALAAYVRGFLEPPVKLVVSDLDNTMWGGIVAETGIDGILIGGNDTGESHLRYQHFLKAQVANGLLLAVCSKNDDTIAKAPFLGNLEMPLKLDEIVAFKASFQSKAAMIREMAEELNLGLQSFLFIDDESHERQEVREHCSDVQVVPWPDDGITGVVPWLLRHGILARPRVTTEDLSRTKLYLQEQARVMTRTRFADLGDYLRSLELCARLHPINESNMDRVIQLIQKTNQFNLTTKRHTSDDVATLIGARDAYAKVLYLEDKYGPYGLTGVIIGAPIEDCMYIDTFVMSCRIMGKTAERAFIDDLIQHTLRSGYSTVEGQFCPTNKNRVVATLYSDLGFHRVQDEGLGIRFQLDNIANYRPQNQFIRVVVD